MKKEKRKIKKKKKKKEEKSKKKKRKKKSTRSLNGRMLTHDIHSGDSSWVRASESPPRPQDRDLVRVHGPRQKEDGAAEWPQLCSAVVVSSSGSK